MNKSQEKAYNWLLKNGYKIEDIDYKSYRNPDFICRDGKRFVVKKLYGKTVWFYGRQLDTIKKIENCQVLIMADNNENPIAIVPVEKIIPGLIIDNEANISITRVEKNKQNALERISISKKTDMALNYIMSKMNNKNKNDVVAWCIEIIYNRIIYFEAKNIPMEKMLIEK